MPWSTPTLRQVREMVRDDITAAVSGVSMVGNSVLRVMSDANAGLAHLTLRYIDWLARQFLPDTAEMEWLDRHGDIWLKNSDGTLGRKLATASSGTVVFTGITGTVIPESTILIATTPDGEIQYQTTEQITLGPLETPCSITAIDPGAAGNLETGTTIDLLDAIFNVDRAATVVLLTGGTDDESSDDLRGRVLERIRQPPMGGCKTDYVAWVKSIPGVTRAWAYPNEMGIGTVTVRFMMDELRADNHGIPGPLDVINATEYLDMVRPVCVKDFWLIAPEKFEIEIHIENLSGDTEATRARIEANLRAMFAARSIPGQTMMRSWVDEAISRAVGEDVHDLVFSNTPAPTPNHLPVLGTITYGTGD